LPSSFFFSSSGFFATPTPNPNVFFSPAGGIGAKDFFSVGGGGTNVFNDAC